jgi:glycosyltransferase involved in cell wall biosynthesis
MMSDPKVAQRRMRIAYLSLQAVVEGQDSWAAVTEPIKGFEAFGWQVDRYFVTYPEAAPGPLGRLAEMYRVRRRLAAAIEGYDLLYVRAHPMAYRAATAARRAGVPVVQECNGPYEDLFIAWPVTRFARPLFEHLQRRQYRDALVIISVAEGLTAWLAEDTGNPNVVTNGNGANTDVFTPDALRMEGLPERYAVFFGQFPAWQGIPTLLSAVRSAQWPVGLSLVFVGDGSLRPEVERAVAEMPDRVRYVGKLPYADVARVASHALLSFVPMVAPERDAKFSPLKLYESMACGVAVVASDTVGISEVVRKHDCGILVPPGDAGALVGAVSLLAEDPARAAQMGSRGREAAVTCYSWDTRARQRAEIIKRALASRER